MPETVYDQKRALDAFSNISDNLFSDAPELTDRVRNALESGVLPECRAAIIALASYVAYLERDKVSYDGLKGFYMPSCPTSFHKKANKKLVENSDTAGARKRKAAADTPAPRKFKKEWQEKLDSQQQYYLGKSIMDDSMKSNGCGNYLLGTLMLPFKSPVASEMRLEIMDGFGAPGRGCIRFHARDEFVGPDPRCFLFPFVHMEQVLVLPPVKKTKAEAHRIVIVPVGSADASAISRDLPKIVEFSLPNKKAGSDLGGRHGNKASPKETYLSLFTRTCNERLSGSDKSGAKSVEQFDEEYHLSAALTMNCDGPSINAKGQLTLLGTGLFFSWNDRSCYLSHASIESVLLVVDKQIILGGQSGDPTAVNLQLWVNAYHTDREEQPLLLTFSGLKPTPAILKQYSRYLERYSITHKSLQQRWYDYKKDLLMIGLEAWTGF